MDNKYKNLLKKQGYKFIGGHSGLKTCAWTKKSLLNKGVCYKQKFYGIKSHLCVQMSPVINFCDMDCIFCWRKRDNSSFGVIDRPKTLLDNIPESQRKALSGIGGNKNVDKIKFKESLKPKHIAISLTGEPCYYPRLNEFIRKSHERGYSTFLVTNGQLPEVLEKMEDVTQLYVSLDAPNRKLFEKIDKPLRKNAWERLHKSLTLLKRFKRTCVRITLIKGYNMVNASEWGTILEEYSPLFVEVKGFMLVGASRNKLRLDNMPLFNEVKDFSLKICDNCSYKIIDEQEQSRVVLLMKKDVKNRVMDF